MCAPRKLQAKLPGVSPFLQDVLCIDLLNNTGLAIYTQKGGSEASFIEDVHNIFKSIGDLEHHMPAEYVMTLDQGHVKVGGLEFAKATQATARTSSSLYLSIYQVPLLS